MSGSPFDRHLQLYAFADTINTIPSARKLDPGLIYVLDKFI